MIVRVAHPTPLRSRRTASRKALKEAVTEFITNFSILKGVLERLYECVPQHIPKGREYVGEGFPQHCAEESPKLFT